MNKSLPRTLIELEKSKDLVLCIYHVQDKLQRGICIEIRTIKDGELLNESMILPDQIIQKEKRIDILDVTCSAILENVRLFRENSINRRF